MTSEPSNPSPDERPDQEPVDSQNVESSKQAATPPPVKIHQNMILQITANEPRFKTVRFQPGMNMILADKTNKSSDKDSRNGVGKTLLIDIIHFLFGGKREGKALKSSELDSYIFSMDLRLGGKECTIHRALKNAKTVGVDGDFSDWPVHPKLNKKSNQHELDVSEWCDVLGRFMFGLSKGSTKSEDEVSFRSLFAYLARRDADHAYKDPFCSFPEIREGQKQSNNAFLLNLGVEYALRLEEIRKKDHGLRSLRTAMKSGILGEAKSSKGRLEADIAVLEKEVAEGTEGLATFHVVPEYAKIETEATALTSEIHDRQNEICLQQTTLEFYKQNIENEKAPGQAKVETLYREAGIVLPDFVTRRLDDVERFHQQLVQNRREFLNQEMERIERLIQKLGQETQKLDEKRSQLMSILKQGGALQEYTALQDKHSQRMAKLEQLRLDLQNIKQLEERTNALKIEKAKLNHIAWHDIEDRQAIKKKAMTLFEEYSRDLYGEAGGRLIIEWKDDTGYYFDMDMPRSGSGGIEAMKVFCYDFTLASLWANKEFSPGILIHDSAIFDPCDARQTASALRLAARQAETDGFQYIFMLNSDRVPREELDGFDIDHYVRWTLTDQEDGCLLGFRLATPNASNS
jgi:uncharacterized protein YydD (DUF2326 family)